MTRRQARRHAFSLIFQFPFFDGAVTETLAEAKRFYYENLDELPRGKNGEYIDRVVWGVFERQPYIDGVIENFLREWEIDRINKVDLAILRLAIFEMLCESDVSHATAANEAVELAKEFGTDDSPGFVNGVLSNVIQAVPKGE